MEAGEELGDGDNCSGSHLGEGYPPNWWHCVIHLDPEAGEMHSDGDHRVRCWLARRLKTMLDAIRSVRAINLLAEQKLRDAVAMVLQGEPPSMTEEQERDYRSSLLTPKDNDLLRQLESGAVRYDMKFNETGDGPSGD